MLEIVNKTDFKINKYIIEKAVLNFFEFFNKKGELTIVFVDENEIKKLNKKYRNKDKVTDILSFQEDDDCSYFGELVICLKQIKNQASKFNNDFNTELIFMISHGILHLQGYEDETEKGILKMEKISTDFMKKYYD